MSATIGGRSRPLLLSALCACVIALGAWAFLARRPPSGQEHARQNIDRPPVPPEPPRSVESDFVNASEAAPMLGSLAGSAAESLRLDASQRVKLEAAASATAQAYFSGDFTQAKALLRSMRVEIPANWDDPKMSRAIWDYGAWMVRDARIDPSRAVLRRPQARSPGATRGVTKTGRRDDARPFLAKSPQPPEQRVELVVPVRAARPGSSAGEITFRLGFEFAFDAGEKAWVLTALSSYDLPAEASEFPPPV